MRYFQNGHQYEISKGAGMKMSIFDHFLSKETDEQEKKIFRPSPYKRMYSELDTTSKDTKTQYPNDKDLIDDFLQLLKEACKARCEKAQNSIQQPMKAEARFFLSADHMSAYACVLPPENEGEPIALEEFLEDMHYEGIHHGMLEEEIRQGLELGYLHIFPVARGSLPQAGEDGTLTEFFHRRKDVRLEIQDGSQVDFSEDIQLQPIRKGTVICQIQPPKPGIDGMDVTGQKIPGPQPQSVFVPQGKNTAIEQDGHALTAGVDGILYIEDDLFCIHEQKIIHSDLNQFQGVLRISGNLYIEGSVDGGVEVEVFGDIVVAGKMGQARMTSTGGTIRVQQGIYGTKGKTFLKADHQVQSPVMEQAEIDAGTSVVAETISGSVIRCGETVYAIRGRGMIVDSSIWAGDSVLCLRVGNLAGGRSRFSVGYPPYIPEAWEHINSELTEVRSTLELLWRSITDLRRKGTRISPGEKSVLDQLVEQRDLYTDRRDTLTAELSTVNQTLNKKSTGKIWCEKLYPCLDVQIGRAAEEITTEEENCNIHIVENRILLK